MAYVYIYFISRAMQPARYALRAFGVRHTAKEEKMEYETFYQVTYWRVLGNALSLDYTSQYLDVEEDEFLDAIALAENKRMHITTQICERGFMREHDAFFQAKERALQVAADRQHEDEWRGPR
jgi:hypothetical protein